MEVAAILNQPRALARPTLAQYMAQSIAMATAVYKLKFPLWTRVTLGGSSPFAHA